MALPMLTTLLLRLLLAVVFVVQNVDSRVNTGQHIQQQLERKDANVLVIYTGGTIGMRPNDHAAYAPDPDFLANLIRDQPWLNKKIIDDNADEQQEEEHQQQSGGQHEHHHEQVAHEGGQQVAVVGHEGGSETATGHAGSGSSGHEQQPPGTAAVPTLRTYQLPPVGAAKRIIYKLIEYAPLLDSSDMSYNDWSRIATDIRTHYNDYDGFVVLHGTDTMAYTASALSFMLQNLGKPVVLTGSQIPMAETRSDGLGNLIGALIVAGTLDIPEVTVLFNNKLLRGNRCIKIDNHGLKAFTTPNLPPLATLDININVKEDLIFRSDKLERFSVHTELNNNVAILRIFPSMSIEAVNALLNENIKGVVLESYGSGNVPARPESPAETDSALVKALGEAVERGCLVVNVSQCIKGCVDPAYENGRVLREKGVIFASDMTTEAALTKLAYVLGKKEWDHEMKKKMLVTNLAGELTVPKTEILPPTEYTKLNEFLSNHSNPDIKKIMIHALACYAVSKDDVKNLENLENAGADLHAQDESNSGRNLLHVAAAGGHVEAVKFLLKRNVNVHVRDTNGENPLLTAIRSRKRNLDIIALIHRVGGDILYLGSKKIANELHSVVLSKDRQAIAAWHAAGADLSIPISNYDGNTALHVAASIGFPDICQVLIAHGASLTARNAAGKTAEQLAQEGAAAAPGDKKKAETVKVFQFQQQKEKTADGHNKSLLVTRGFGHPHHLPPHESA